MQEHYRELGLPAGASEEAVREAFLALSRQFHPDLHDGDPAYEEKFKRVNIAYQHIKARREGRVFDARKYRQARDQSQQQTQQQRATIGAYVLKKLTEIVTATQQALEAGNLDRQRAIEQLYALFSPQVLQALQQERSKNKPRIVKRLMQFYTLIAKADLAHNRQDSSFSIYRLHTLVDLITKGDATCANLRHRYFGQESSLGEDSYHETGIVTLRTVYYAVAIGVFFLFVLFTILLAIKKTPCDCPTEFHLVPPRGSFGG